MRLGAHRVERLETSRYAPLQLEDVPEPPLPAPDWVRVRPLLSGICGSDLATLTSESSPYFSPVTSPPFVMGHEVVGAVAEDSNGFRAGERVVVEPALGLCGAWYRAAVPDVRRRFLRLMSERNRKRKHLRRHPDRVLPGHRRRLVGGYPGSPSFATAPGAGWSVGRGGGRRRTAGLRGPRRAQGRAGTGGHRARPRAPGASGSSWWARCGSLPGSGA